MGDGAGICMEVDLVRGRTGGSHTCESVHQTLLLPCLRRKNVSTWLQRASNTPPVRKILRHLTVEKEWAGTTPGFASSSSLVSIYADMVQARLQLHGLLRYCTIKLCTVSTCVPVPGRMAFIGACSSEIHA